MAKAGCIRGSAGKPIGKLIVQGPSTLFYYVFCAGRELTDVSDWQALIESHNRLIEQKENENQNG